jgi:hypothetical protein
MIAQDPAKPPTLLEVFDQGLALELHEDIDCINLRIDKIGEDKVNEAVLAPEGHGRLSPIPGKRE